MDSTASDTASADGVIVSDHGKIAVWAGQGGSLLKEQAPSSLLFLAISWSYLNGIPGLIKHLPLDRDDRLRHCRLHEPCWFIHPQNWNTVYISSVTAPSNKPTPFPMAQQSFAMLHLDPEHTSCIGGRTVLTCRSCAGNAPR